MIRLSAVETYEIMWYSAPEDIYVSDFYKKFNHRNRRKEPCLEL